jgi:ABC-type methionine transport system permease subunit
MALIGVLVSYRWPGVTPTRLIILVGVVQLELSGDSCLTGEAWLGRLVSTKTDVNVAAQSLMRVVPFVGFALGGTWPFRRLSQIENLGSPSAISMLSFGACPFFQRFVRNRTR